MTRDEIIRMMRSVCDKDKVDAWQCDFWTITQDELERLFHAAYAAGAAAEREECAKVPDAFPQAHRLALELECLLLSSKDTASLSKWWDSAHEALEQWREFCRVELQPNAKVSGGGAFPPSA